MDKYAELTALTMVILAALSFGLLMTRLRQPAIVGYILAGFALGPTGIGLVGDTAMIRTLADLGVIMLLFVIGMELSLRAFKSVLAQAIGAAILQIGFSVAIALGLSAFFTLTTAQAVLAGFIMALSSTAVVIKILEDVGELRTQLGRIAVGVLIAQDLAVVPMLLIVGDLGKGGFEPTILLKLAGAGLSLAAVIWYLSRRERVHIPWLEKVADREDLAPIAALAICFGMATISGLLGMSAAFGAFLGGLIVGNSSARAQIWSSIKPIETCLLLIFFLSIGLLIDFNFIMQNWQLVLGCLIAATLLKTLINVVALRLMGECWGRAFTAGILLGQLGEFAFVLAATALSAGIINENGYALALAVIALSLLTSSLWKLVAQRAHNFAATSVGNLRLLVAIIFCDEIGTLERCATAIRRNATTSLSEDGTLTGIARRLRRLRLDMRGQPMAETTTQVAAELAKDQPI